MSKETLDYGHWVLDNDLGNAGSERKSLLAIESIKSQVDEYNSINTKNNSDTLVSNKNVPKIKNPFGYRVRPSLNYYKKTQHWLGVIEEISGDVFSAKLTDKSNEGTYEYADFDFNEVSKSDLSMITLGAVFYYSIGFASNNGQIRKEAFLRFKRSVPFSSHDVDNLEERVKSFNQNINWE